MELAKAAFDDSLADLDCLCEDSYTDTVRIMELLRNNFPTPTEEEEEDLSPLGELDSESASDSSSSSSACRFDESFAFGGSLGDLEKAPSKPIAKTAKKAEKQPPTSAAARGKKTPEKVVEVEWDEDDMGFDLFGDYPDIKITIPQPQSARASSISSSLKAKRVAKEEEEDEDEMGFGLFDSHYDAPAPRPSPTPVAPVPAPAPAPAHVPAPAPEPAPITAQSSTDKSKSGIRREVGGFGRIPLINNYCHLLVHPDERKEKSSDTKPKPAPVSSHSQTLRSPEQAPGQPVAKPVEPKPRQTATVHLVFATVEHDRRLLLKQTRTALASHKGELNPASFQTRSELCSALMQTYDSDNQLSTIAISFLRGSFLGRQVYTIEINRDANAKEIVEALSKAHGFPSDAKHMVLSTFHPSRLELGLVRVDDNLHTTWADGQVLFISPARLEITPIHQLGDLIREIDLLDSTLLAQSLSRSTQLLQIATSPHAIEKRLLRLGLGSLDGSLFELAKKLLVVAIFAAYISSARPEYEKRYQELLEWIASKERQEMALSASLLSLPGCNSWVEYGQTCLLRALCPAASHS